jgi:hypothetical protein
MINNNVNMHIFLLESKFHLIYYYYFVFAVKVISLNI